MLNPFAPLWSLASVWGYKKELGTWLHKYLALRVPPACRFVRSLNSNKGWMEEICITVLQVITWILGVSCPFPPDIWFKTLWGIRAMELYTFWPEVWTLSLLFKIQLAIHLMVGLCLFKDGIRGFLERFKFPTGFSSHLSFSCNFLNIIKVLFFFYLLLKFYHNIISIFRFEAIFFLLPPFITNTLY